MDQVAYLRTTFLKIKFENWNFEELFENRNLRIGILKNYLKTEILKIKFEN